MISIQSSILYFANHYLHIYSIRDCVEIIFFSMVTFTISSWLNKDYTKPLLLYFYSYFAVLLTAYFFQLPTVYQVMLMTAPIYFMLLMIYHQKNLQKSFVLSQHKSLTPAKAILHKEWLETLMRACLIASHQKKNITCIIQQHDNLESLLDKPFIIDIPIQKQIIDMMLESTSYDSNKIILVTYYGTLITINASWSDLIMNELLFTPIAQNQLHQEYAKIITKKSDAILMHINSEHEHHFIAHQGKIIEQITIDQALKLIKNILYKKNNDPLPQGINHDPSKSASFSSFYKD